MEVSARLFIAVPVSILLAEELSTQARETAAEPAAFRWTKPRNAHLTIAFIGETPAMDILQISARLAEKAKQFAKFELPFLRVETRIRRGAPPLIWARFEAVAEWRTLSAAFDELRGGKRFADPLPHITLARGRTIGAKATPQHSVYKTTKTTKTPLNAAVQEIALYASELHPEGADYRILCKADLKLTGVN